MIFSTQEQQEQFEENWLQWARSVLVSGPCKACTTNDGTIFDQVLWPGYIGKRYSKGLVLLVGAVHNAKQLQTQEMEQLAEFAKSWVTERSSQSDHDYLEKLRSAYLTSARRKWIRDGQVWGVFRDIKNALGLSWEHVAFTNWNKCKTPAGGGLYNKHINVYQDVFERLPITELRPSMVFICCGDRAAVVNKIKNAPLQNCHIRIFNQPTTRKTATNSPLQSKFPDHQQYPKWRDDDASVYKAAILDRERTGNHAQVVPARQQQLTAALPACDATAAHVAAAGVPTPLPQRPNDETHAAKGSGTANANAWRTIVLRRSAAITLLGNTSRPDPDSKSHRMYSSLQNGQTVASALAAKDQNGKQACNSDYLKWFIYKGFVRQD